MKLFIALISLTWALQAQPVRLEFEPTSTTVEYKVDSTLHTVHGTFALTSGAIEFDTSTGEAQGELVVNAASGDSDNGSRDRRMNKAVLEAEKFAEIKFVADHVEGQAPSAAEDSEVKLHGQFLLHGTAHEMVLVAKLHHEHGAYKVSSSFEVPYVEWGLKNPSMLFLRVSDTVEIHVEAEAKAAAS